MLKFRLERGENCVKKTCIVTKKVPGRKSISPNRKWSEMILLLEKVSQDPHQCVSKKSKTYLQLFFHSYVSYNEHRIQNAMSVKYDKPSSVLSYTATNELHVQTMKNIRPIHKVNNLDLETYLCTSWKLPQAQNFSIVK